MSTLDTITPQDQAIALARTVSQNAQSIGGDVAARLARTVTLPLGMGDSVVTSKTAEVISTKPSSTLVGFLKMLTSKNEFAESPYLSVPP